VAPVQPAAEAPEPLTPVTRLRQRLAAMPETRPANRDPFQFAARPRNAAPVEPAADAPAANPVPIDTRPRLQLLGIAQDVHDGQPVRTAVVGGMNQVYLVGEGDQIALRFLVKRVGADSVEVEDMTDGTTVTLAWP
jgi:hypothetical protein